jgi:hypothetical protein
VSSHKLNNCSWLTAFICLNRFEPFELDVPARGSIKRPVIRGEARRAGRGHHGRTLPTTGVLLCRYPPSLPSTDQFDLSNFEQRDVAWIH